MKKKLAVLAAGICALSLFLTGCSGEISNDYVTITKYKGVEIDKVDADAVSDNDVEAQINSVLQSKSTTTEVTDRAAQTGDTVTIDYEGKKDGVAFDGGTATDAQLTLGSGQFIDGFEDGVVGHNIGDTFDLDLTFPENYGNEDLAGQAVVFTVTLKGISQTDVPELTDEFVQSVSDTSKTVEEYKKEIKKSLKKNGKENQQNTIKENAWKAVLENTTVNKYPKKDLKNMISSIKTQYKNMASYYNLDFADFLKQYMNMDEETFNSKATQAAKDQVKANLAADLIIEKAKIDVSDKTLEKKYKEYAKAYGYEDVDALKKALEDAGNLENLEKTVGKINNADQLIRNLYENGHTHFQSMTNGQINSTELVAALICKKDSFVEGIRYVQSVVEGSMTLLLLTENGIYAARDLLGRTPVVIGKKENAYCVSFESFAYINLGYTDYKELGPGEIVYVTPESVETVSPACEKMRICSFLWVYYGYPTSSYEGVGVEEMRYNCGKLLAQRDDHSIDVDIVAGVPDSGIAHAIGYANESGIPYARPFIKYTPTWPRSFMPTTQSQRNLIARMKLIPV